MTDPREADDSEAGSESTSGGDSDEGAEAAELGLDGAPPEFYDPEADDRDERWMSRVRRGNNSDAILSCPLCFATVCAECQQHELYENQFRAMFVLNCRIDTSQVVKVGAVPSTVRRRAQGGRRQAAGGEPAPPAAAPGPGGAAGEERYNPVHCAACDTELGLRELPPSGVYHLFNVVASTA